MKKLAFSFLVLLCSFASMAQNDTDVVGKNIDKTVQPGDDFFKYANGRWIKQNPIPNAYSQWGIGNLVIEDVWAKLKAINENAMSSNANDEKSKKIGNFYLAAMDTATIEKLKLSPIADKLAMINTINNISSLLKVITYFHSIGISTGFDFGVYQDMKDSEKNALYLSQGGIGLPNRDYYFNKDAQTLKIVKDYKTKHLPEMLGFLNPAYSISAVSVFNLEKALAYKSRKLEDLRDPYANYHKMSIAQLNQLTPKINWNTIFKQLQLKTDSVIVGQPEFFKQLNKLLTNIPLATWKNYLRFHLLSNTAAYLNQKVHDEDFRFYETVIRGKKEQLPRWKQVLQWEESAMGELLGELYVKDNFSATTKLRYEKLCDNVFAAFADRIKKLDWMSNATKQKSLLKLNAVTKKVGYPDKWKDFSAMQIGKVPYVINVQHARQWWHNYEVNKLGKPVDRTEWDMTPQTYNAYYNPSNNEIVLPAGQFAVPGKKDDDLDDAFVYGYAAASTIGHEMTHGFDDQGRQYDANGNLKGWWTPADSIQFSERAAKIIAQFNEFNPVDTLHINGSATQGENIADLGGLLIGIDAFRKTDTYKKGEKIAGFTPIQRYFLGYAYSWLYKQRKELLASQLMTDVHAPAKERVNGPVVNVPEFYETFNVKPGDKMYRPDSLRVNIW